VLRLSWEVLAEVSTISVALECICLDSNLNYYFLIKKTIRNPTAIIPIIIATATITIATTIVALKEVELAVVVDTCAVFFEVVDESSWGVNAFK